MKRSDPIPDLLFILLYAAAAIAVIRHCAATGACLWLLVLMTAAGIGLIHRVSRTSAVELDFCNMAILIWLFYPHANARFPVMLLMPLVTALFVTRGHYTIKKLHAYLIAAFALAWMIAAAGIAAAPFSWGLLIPVSVSLAMLGLFLRGRRTSPSAAIASMEVILCSYSGNTEHFTNTFIEEAVNGGTTVTLHRFHRHEEFRAELHADSLVVAFPVIGWKAPWPLFNYLLFRLPRGKGKPAFILFSCAGGPENTGIASWLILTLKGYRVRGFNWAIYPMNVTGFRLGPGRLWKYLDSLLPREQDIAFQKECARAFISGHACGLPVIFSPTPLFILGPLIDNIVVDTILSHNHLFKARCNKCTLCVRYCPTQRLKVNDGYPYSWGSCSLCFGCVNICPRNAMHLWCFSEYGNAYRPRWLETMIAKCTPADDRPHES